MKMSRHSAGRANYMRIIRADNSSYIPTPTLEDTFCALQRGATVRGLDLMARILTPSSFINNMICCPSIALSKVHLGGKRDRNTWCAKILVDRSLHGSRRRQPRHYVTWSRLPNRSSLLTLVPDRYASALAVDIDYSHLCAGSEARVLTKNRINNQSRARGESRVCCVLDGPLQT